MVDLAQVFNDKVEFGSKLSKGQVDVALLFQVFLQNCRLSQRSLDGGTLGFSLVEGIQELLVLQNIPRGGIELIQECIFQVRDLDLEFFFLFEQVRLALFKLRPLEM